MKNVKLTSAGLMAVLALSMGCRKSQVDNKDLKDFAVVNLVADTTEYQPRRLDPTLINGFGIAWSPTGIAWVNSVGGHVSELYNADGMSVRPAVNIPSPTDSVGGFPCGIVFSGGMGFTLPNGLGKAAFLFSGFDGVISGWNGGNNAVFLKHPRNASYTGLAIASNNGHNLIYAANFGQRKIDVWDTQFNRVELPFSDPLIPDAFSPYNIQAVGDKLFVIYGQLATANDKNPGHGVAGPGKGYVDVYNPDGRLVQRFAKNGTLNLPWGVTMAPASFLENKDVTVQGTGIESKAYGGGVGGSRGNNDPSAPVILVGNFGDGRINVFNQEGKYLGQLQSHKHPIEIEGLWALSFPPAGANIDPGKLYFSAGPDEEAHGVFGYLFKQ